MNIKRFTVVAFLFLSVALCGCDALVDTIITEPEENDFVGVWTIHSINGQTWEEAYSFEDEIALADSFSVWTFSPDDEFELLLGWTPAPNSAGVFFLPQIYFRIEGTYALTGSSYTMTVGESIGFFDMAEGDETMGGTWGREADMLTLNDDEGTVIVLKERI